MKRIEISASFRSFLIWVMVSLALVIIDQLGWTSGSRSKVEALLVPFERKFYQASRGIQRPWQMLKFWNTGVEKIEDLERQVAQLTSQALRVEQLEEENASLRKLLGAVHPPQRKFIPAAIVAREDELALDVGSESGVEIDDGVVWEDVLIGTVIEVTPRMSRVRLLADTDSSIAVYLPSTGADGLLQGRFGSQMVMVQVLQTEELKTDAMVATSGEFGLPRGLVVGKVSEVISDETDVYQEAIVKPVADSSRLQTVFVVKN